MIAEDRLLIINAARTLLTNKQIAPTADNVDQLVCLNLTDEEIEYVNDCFLDDLAVRALYNIVLDEELSFNEQAIVINLSPHMSAAKKAEIIARY